MLIIVILFSVKLYYGGTTSIAVALSLLLLQIVNRYTKVILYIALIVLVIALLVFIKPYLDLLISEDTFKIDDILRMNSLFAIDGNATIRLLIWGYLFFEVFLNNLFGIGLGTTFISHHITYGKLNMTIQDPYLEYTLGAHNSFLTILIRFGIIGLLPFIFLYLKLIKDFIRDKESRQDSIIIFFYYAFFITTCIALLNVVLESPKQASLYWGTLGMLYQAKKTAMIENSI